MVKRVTLWLVGAVALTVLCGYLVYSLAVVKVCIENGEQGTATAQVNVPRAGSCS